MNNVLLREITFNGLNPSIFEELDGGITYIGYCKFGTQTENTKSWCIKRVQVNGNITTQKWAEGSLNFNLKWSERANYEYHFPKQQQL